MPLTALQTTKIFEIIGVPQSGNGAIFASVATLFGAEYETYDMAGIVTIINAKITGLTTEQQTLCTALLTRYDEITAAGPLEIIKSGGSEGILANSKVEREGIRRSLGNIIGIAVPSGGFYAEAKRLSDRTSIVR